MLNSEVDISNILEKNKELCFEAINENYKEFYPDNESYGETSRKTIIDEYKNNIENGIIDRLKESGYHVKKIDCDYDKHTLEPNYLYVELLDDDREIQPVEIEVSHNKKNLKNSISISDLNKIRKIIKDTYGIDNVEVVEWRNY